MKILLASRAPLSSQTGSPIRGRYLAECLALQGAHVVTVSPGPCRHLLGRISHMECGSLDDITAFIEFNGHRFDILICLTVWEAGAILHAARVAGLPCVVDCHGLEIVQMLDAQANRVLHVVELHRAIGSDVAAMRADGIIAANSVVLEWCVRAFAPVCDAVGITDVYRFADAIPTPRDELPIRVLYSGGSQYWQNIEVFLAAVPLVLQKSKDFTFHVLTKANLGSSLAARLDAMAASGQILLEPYKDFVDYPSFLANFDIGVIPREFFPTSYQSFPQKMVDYMAGGLCVVATEVYPYPEVFSTGEKGVLCPPNPQGIANAVLALRSRAVRKIFGENARQYAQETFAMQVRGPVLMNFLRGVIEGKAGGGHARQC